LVAIWLGYIDFIIFIERCVKESPNDVDLLAFKVQNGREKQKHLNTSIIGDGSIEILVLPVLIVATDDPASSVADPFVL
jgi:hypothetical protein